MLTLSINLEKKGKDYIAALVAEDGQNILHTDDWGKVTLASSLTRRFKVITLNGKNLGIALNIINNNKRNESRSKATTRKHPKKGDS